MVTNLKLHKSSGKNKTNYFRDVQAELKKVTWTTKEELISFTKIILGATFVFGMGIYLADLSIRGILSFIGLIARVVFG